MHDFIFFNNKKIKIIYSGILCSYFIYKITDKLFCLVFFDFKIKNIKQMTSIY